MSDLGNLIARHGIGFCSLVRFSLIEHFVYSTTILGITKVIFRSNHNVHSRLSIASKLVDAHKCRSSRIINKGSQIIAGSIMC